MQPAIHLLSWDLRCILRAAQPTDVVPGLILAAHCHPDRGEDVTKLLQVFLSAAAVFALSAAGVNAGGSLDAVVAHISEAPDGPGRQVVAAAIAAYERALTLGAVTNRDRLTVIDYTRPSTEPRLWVVDLSDGRILYRELVSHGQASGDNFATTFSNVPETKMSSLGLFVTDDSYVGANGYSLRLRGLDAGINDNAYARAIVVHGAAYVSQAVSERLGRLGRSWGCPAVRLEVARPLIDAIKGGSVLFAYGPPSPSPVHR
jgi:hypothetical protein